MDQGPNAFPIYLVPVQLQVSFYGKEFANNNDDGSNNDDNNNNDNNIKIIATNRNVE